MIRLTIFKNLYDNKTDKNMSFSSLDDFAAFLYNLSKQPYKDKKEASLISPATFHPDTTRANKSVVEWSGWCAVDVDDIVFEGDIEQELKELYGEYTYICYSTASSSKKQPKFRMVFPLTANVPNEKIKHFWFALNKTLGEIGDPQTKDLSRMYFVPGTYEGAYNFFFANVGKLMDPYEIMGNYDYVEKITGNSFLDNLPESIRNQIMAHRKSQMTNIDVSWTGYRDCPFINQKLVSEYQMISGTGWYHKMYQIMVSIAMNAIKDKYPITAQEIADMCSQIDMENGGWYKNRPLVREADGAINFAYENVDINT